MRRTGPSTHGRGIPLACVVVSAVLAAGCARSRTLGTEAGGCTACHGGLDNESGAPPRDARGEVSGIGVGAHTAHVDAGIGCEACHVKPSSVGDPGHIDGDPRVTFHGLADPGATWDGAAATCTAVYCHGGTLGAGGSNHEPSWTTPATGACGTCHFAPGTPPPTGHPQLGADGGALTTAAACRGCHSETVLADGTIDRAGGKHVDGSIEVDAPGDHASPTWAQQAEHGYAANRRGLAACTACHGLTFDGGLDGWAPSCNGCHADAGWSAAGVHGDWQKNCTFCHGTRTDGYTLATRSIETSPEPAPPMDRQGGWSTSLAGVGAHARHVGIGSAISSGVACPECHAIPTTLAHVDGSAQAPIDFGGGRIARQGVSGPSTYADGVCSNLYCHGATLSGGTATPPAWAPPSTLQCWTCHGYPPDTGTLSGFAFTGHWLHASGETTMFFPCVACHGTATDAWNPAVHVNGAVDVNPAKLHWHPAGCPDGCTAECHLNRTTECRTWIP